MTDFEQCGDALTGAACPENHFERLDLVAQFRRTQAATARQAQIRQEAVTQLCVQLDMSLVMLAAVVGVVGRKAADPHIKRAVELMTGELRHLDQYLAHALRLCAGDTGGEG